MARFVHSIDVAVLVFLLGALSCQAQAGMFCQMQSDCRVGLVCSKSPNATATGYGVCEPGRKGAGETCLRSSDCQDGLRCSNELGEFNDDNYHGVCETGPDLGTDGGLPDLQPPADFSTPPDQSAGN